jgi:hypothetical protein
MTLQIQGAQLLMTCALLAAGQVRSAQVFSFWPGEGADRAPGFIELDDGPCGQIARARVSRLPSSRGTALQSELAVEIDSRGRIIRRWPYPVNYLPVAVQGDQLLVTWGSSGEGLWITPEGRFSKARLPKSTEGELASCHLDSVFPGSAYAQCQRMPDRRTKRMRTIGYQAVCS